MLVNRSKLSPLASLLAAIGLLSLMACSDASSDTASDDETMPVVVSSNIVGEWVRIVGGDRVDVFDLVPAGVDPHSHQPGARDIARVSDAVTVFAVGLRLEQRWLEELIENASADPDDVVELGPRVDPIEFSFEDQGGARRDEEENEKGEQHVEDENEIHDEDDGHDHGALDPHFWFDPQRTIVAVRQIAKELKALDPDSADHYDANRDAYISQLEELDTWILEQVSAIDVDDRHLVTTHDSLGYFANRYGFKVAGVIIPGGGTELERSPQEMAHLVDEVEEIGASVVFAEEQLSDRLANTLAREAGIRFVGGLYVGSLGDDGSGVSTYIDLMRNNVDIIVEALEE